MSFFGKRTAGGIVNTALDPAGEQDCLGTLQLLVEAHPIGWAKKHCGSLAAWGCLHKALAVAS